MKSIIQLMILAISITAVSCTAQQPHIDVKKATLIDVRTPEEFAEGSVPGAINIPLNEIEQHLSDFTNKPQVVVFCRSGNRSAQATAILNRHGIKNVVDGGAWQTVDKIIREQLTQTTTH